MEERRREDLCERLRIGEVLVVALGLAREQHVQGVVDVVGPLAREAQAGGATVGHGDFAGHRLAPARRHSGGVVAVGLGHDDDAASEALGCGFEVGDDLLEDVHGRLVDERVHGVEAEGVDVEALEPHERVLDDEATHLVAVRAVEVDGRAPRGLADLVVDRHEDRQVVAVRPEVVVDDVEAHGEALGVARVDERLERLRAAVDAARGVPVDAVVTPVPAARNGIHRQDLDVRHAEVDEVVEASSRRLERALLGERADVQFVEDSALETVAAGARVVALPLGVAPLVLTEVDDLARAVHALGLQQAARIGTQVAAVHAERVLAADGERLARVPPAVVTGAHEGTYAVGHEVDAALGVGRPDRDGLRRPGEVGRCVGGHRHHFSCTSTCTCPNSWGSRSPRRSAWPSVTTTR